MILLMLGSQYCMLIALSILLMEMAPYYTEHPRDYKLKARILLIPLHFIYVWLAVITVMTAHGGFCTEAQSYPKVLYMVIGLFSFVTVIMMVLRCLRF